jgi:hypothetical protein
VIDELGRELSAVGIHGRQRERILTEFADHLACEPSAQLGDPRTLAAHFADEFASDAARRSAMWSFGALSLVALALVAPQVALPTVPDIAGGRSLLLAGLATLAMVVGAQIAFAAGSLALLRAWRLRSTPALPAEEVSILRRRVAVALAAGAATAVGSGLYAVNFWNVVPGWWAAVALGAAGATALPLGFTAAAQARTASLRVSKAGAAGGLSADLGVVGRPWLIGTAAVLAVLVVTALAEGSLLEGALRAGFEGVAFAGCFVAFRRFLVLTG